MVNLNLLNGANRYIYRPYSAGMAQAEDPSAIPAAENAQANRNTALSAPALSGRMALDPSASGLSMQNRVRPVGQAELDELSKAAYGEAVAGKTPAQTLEAKRCETCENRRYQDGSNDPGVSFKTPTKLTPEQAATEVRGHEMEHVTREQAKAEREDREVVQQSVTLHTAICPDCGRVYISGGVTRTTTRNKPEEEPLQNPDPLASGDQKPAEA